MKKEKKNVFPKKFRFCARTVFLTYPKCDMSLQDAQKILVGMMDPCNYSIIAREKHKDGTIHLHAVIQSKKKKDVKNERYFDLMGHHPHIESPRSIQDCVVYCKKESEYIEDGVIEDTMDQSSVQKKAARNKLLLETPLNKLVDDGELSLIQYESIRKAKFLYSIDSKKVSDTHVRKSYWIYGVSGIGKTRFIKDTFPSHHFIKSQNKWWDGYNNEFVVVLEDFDLGGQCLGHHMKLWADDYRFQAEIKGGTIEPSYRLFFVTSQYLPEEIFKDDYPLQDAINRRFQIVTVEDGKLIDRFTKDQIDIQNDLQIKKDKFKINENNNKLDNILNLFK